MMKIASVLVAGFPRSFAEATPPSSHNPPHYPHTFALGLIHRLYGLIGGN